ncbi:hypothetical protein [Subtercola lobariae]|uniref:Nucleotidyltransferase n=1 Tax=Subtercola lobariae TaxID=1588641 RepID=A0A917B384_9MICO|nr:hypothetical protein [Subtercola lobariae]GGF15486.1 hypothetical protein GCM10011399_06610 [Subtercola lobariae]
MATNDSQERDHIQKILDYLGEALDPSVLIGGWATFEIVGGEISKDIDLIIGSDEVRQKVLDRVEQLSTSDHLQGKKWRGVVEGIHIDIYIPYQSQLGAKLRLKVEVLARHTDPVDRVGWKLLTIEAHTLTKLAAVLDRPETEKGAKDAGELLRLLEKGVDAAAACAILVEATAVDPDALPEYVDTGFRHIAERSGANKAERRMLDRLRRTWGDEIRAAIDTTQPGRPVIF